MIEHPSVIKKKKKRTTAIATIGVKVVMLSERHQTQKHRYFMIPNTQNFRKTKEYSESK